MMFLDRPRVRALERSLGRENVIKTANGKYWGFRCVGNLPTRSGSQKLADAFNQKRPANVDAITAADVPGYWEPQSLLQQPAAPAHVHAVCLDHLDYWRIAEQVFDYFSACRSASLHLNNQQNQR